MAMRMPRPVTMLEDILVVEGLLLLSKVCEVRTWE